MCIDCHNVLVRDEVCGRLITRLGNARLNVYIQKCLEHDHLVLCGKICHCGESILITVEAWAPPELEGGQSDIDRIRYLRVSLNAPHNPDSSTVIPDWARIPYATQSGSVQVPSINVETVRHRGICRL